MLPLWIIEIGLDLSIKTIKITIKNNYKLTKF